MYVGIYSRDARAEAEMKQDDYETMVLEEIWLEKWPGSETTVANINHFIFPTFQFLKCSRDSRVREDSAVVG